MRFLGCWSIFHLFQHDYASGVDGNDRRGRISLRCCIHRIYALLLNARSDGPSPVEGNWEILHHSSRMCRVMDLRWSDRMAIQNHGMQTGRRPKPRMTTNDAADGVNFDVVRPRSCF